jgi:Protein of unknown function (DUF998)
MILLDWLIILIPLLFFTFQVFFHCVDTGFNPVRETISMYVWCSYGTVQTTAMYLMTIVMLVLSLRLYFILLRNSRTRAGLIIMGLISIGMLLVAIFPTRAHNAVLTWENILHVTTAIAVSGLFPIALLLLAPAFRQKSPLKILYPMSVITAGIAIVVGLMGVIMIVGSLPGLGIVERILMLNSLIWIVLLGIKLLQKDIRHNPERE